MKPIEYKGCKIQKSRSTKVVEITFAGSKINQTVTLWQVSGAVDKSGASLPPLLDSDEARAYVDAQLPEVV